LRKAHETHESL